MYRPPGPLRCSSRLGGVVRPERSGSVQARTGAVRAWAHSPEAGDPCGSRAIDGPGDAVRAAQDDGMSMLASAYGHAVPNTASVARQNQKT